MNPITFLSQTSTGLGRPSPAAPTMAAGPWVDAAQIIQLTVALLLVGALLKWGLPWLMKKTGRIGASGTRIKIAETATLGAVQVHLIEVDGRELLVGCTPQSVSLISDLSTAPEPIAASETITEAPAEEVFGRDFVDEFEQRLRPARPSIEKPTTAVIEVEEEVREDEDQGAMSLTEAMALLNQAKTRIQPPVAEQPSRARRSEPSDAEVMDVLERIKRLTG